MASDGPDRILQALQERAKELNCLYRVDAQVNRVDAPLDDVLTAILQAIPPGWQYPEVCVARITLDHRSYELPGFQETRWRQSAEVLAWGQPAGRVEVFYTEGRPDADEGPFLKEERRLVEAVAERVGELVARRRLRHALDASEGVGGGPDESQREWRVVLDFVAQTDPALFGHVGRKMVQYLVWHGVAEAEVLLRGGDAGADDENRPGPRTAPVDPSEATGTAFQLAARSLPGREILSCVRSWIKEERASFLKSTLEQLDTPVGDLAEALGRFEHSGIQEASLPSTTQLGLRAALVRRFLADDVRFVNTAKQYLEVADFQDLVKRIVYPPRSHGKLGGKGSGLFLAWNILAKSREYADVLGEIRIPRTWYLLSDGILDFIRYNDLGDVYNRKYLDAERVRQEYPHIVQTFKSSCFSPEMVRGLSAVLDDLGDRPLIVRSSSLLEDRMGAAFSGKYKSLFLANVGSRRERLAALTDAVAEVYASVFGPDPIAYRAERGLLDLHEEMGVLIQEVVGTRVGPYFLPAFSGVAFSNNEFRWSPRIRREDGLLRMVPGLGTRAVDRLSDDYPVLVAPGQPGLRVNVSADETLRYSPRRMDVINLESAGFETVDVEDLLRHHGSEVPLLRQMVSLYDQDRIRKPVSLLDLGKKPMVVTFEGLLTGTPFIAQMRGLLKVLREKLGTPVDIEFASDGRTLYLLQCRPQSYARGTAPASIPRDLPRDKVLFTARRHVSNGLLPAITHVVYVDPEAYTRLPEAASLREVGRVVGRLNRLLPKRQFILMGPGRWGSRGDIKLGVPVTYADISNTALLVEIARSKGGYVPELSFGTHFFQDLVEASIRYLPLYPDEEGIVLDETFLRRAPNILASLAPEASGLEDVIRVIDVRRATAGLVLRVLMNADLEEAVGILGIPSGTSEEAVEAEQDREPGADAHWRWRLRMAERIADCLDPERFGVKGFYVFGSTKNATAGPASDIDLLVHVVEDPARQAALQTWLDGWSRCLAEINHLRTGYRVEALLDVHIVTDEDVALRTGFAIKIGAVTDAARPLPMGRSASG